MKRLKERRKKAVSSRKARTVTTKEKKRAKPKINTELLKYIESHNLNYEDFKDLSKEDLYYQLLKKEYNPKKQGEDYEIDNFLKIEASRESFIPCPVCGSKETDIKIRRSTSTDEGDFQVITCRECMEITAKR